MNNFRFGKAARRVRMQFFRKFQIFAAIEYFTLGDLI